MPRITVLTTVYNGLPYLKECIESVLEQTWDDFEFLIVDDASTDTSLECIKSYDDKRINIIENAKNIGQVASLNKALQVAKGEFVARLDQDDVCLPDRLAEQIDFMEKNPDITIVCSWEHTIDSTGNKTRDWKRTITNYGDFLSYPLLGLCPVWHPSVMFKKEAALMLDCFDTSYAPAEDFELWSRIALNRMNAAVVPKFHLLQRVHDRRQSHLQSDKQLDSTQRAHKKTVNKFVSGDNIDCLSALLRLESDPCGKHYAKSHMVEMTEKLKELFDNVTSAQNLSEEERLTLIDNVYKRLGLGVKYAHILVKFPSVLYYPLFYLLSPLLLTTVRQFFSRLYSNYHYLKNIFN